jgi:hypothetical protein
LANRAERIEGDVEREQLGLNTARRIVRDGERARRGEVFTARQRDARNRFLDAQAALPSAAMASALGGGARRDYIALAGLAGYGRREYEQLDPHGRRSARRQIDHELALRNERHDTAREAATSAGEPALSGREMRRANKAFDRRVRERMRDRGQVVPPRGERSIGRPQSHPARLPGARSSESSVLRDAREVAARRKRQLGADRP